MLTQTELLPKKVLKLLWPGCFHDPIGLFLRRSQLEGPEQGRGAVRCSDEAPDSDGSGNKGMDCGEFTGNTERLPNQTWFLVISLRRKHDDGRIVVSLSSSHKIFERNSSNYIMCDSRFAPMAPEVKLYGIAIRALFQEIAAAWIWVVGSLSWRTVEPTA